LTDKQLNVIFTLKLWFHQQTLDKKVHWQICLYIFKHFKKKHFGASLAVV